MEAGLEEMVSIFEFAASKMADCHVLTFSACVAQTTADFVFAAKKKDERTFLKFQYRRDKMSSQAAKGILRVTVASQNGCKAFLAPASQGMTSH